MKPGVRHGAVLVLSALSIFTGAGTALAGNDAATVRLLELTGDLHEKEGPLAWLMGSKEPSLRSVVLALQKAAEDDDTNGVVIRIKDAEISRTQTEEIGAAMDQVRKAGKKVHIYAEGYETAELLLGSHADDVIVQKGGAVSLPGIYMEEMFLADTLNWIGIKADMVQVGDYKGAAEQMSRSSPSPQWDQNINGLLDGLYGNMRTSLKQGRKMDDAKLDAAMAKAWLSDGDDAVKAGLVDSVVDLPDLTAHLEKAYGTSIEWGPELIAEHKEAEAPMANPMALFGMLMKQPQTEPTGPAIAVIHIDGPIVDGDSKGGGIFGGGDNVGSRTIRNALEDVLANDNYKGLVVRINSPGGSAIASEVIWQGLRRVAAKKPVWASVGSMAASGGYYCAVGADRIYVNPSSIVGSIGVVGGRMSMAGLYELGKVHVVSRARGPRAGMFRSTDPWSPEELGLVRAKMTETYDLFTKRVTQGRKGIDLAGTAEGRLFTGDAAIKNKMADKIGGLEVVVADMAKELSLDSYDLRELPGPKPLGEVIEDALGGMMSSPVGARVGGPMGAFGQPGAMLEAIIGPKAFKQLVQPLEAFIQLRDEPMLLVMPSALIFR